MISKEDRAKMNNSLDINQFTHQLDTSTLANHSGTMTQKNGAQRNGGSSKERKSQVIGQQDM